MSISIDIARKVLEASKRRARELRSPVSIAIVDAGGHLVLFERMMSPYGWATSNISIAKASTAVMFNQSTDAVAQWGSGIPGFASSMATMTEGKFIMAAGGWPIRVNGATIGGIGVSGGNAPGRDDEIARAGLAALEVAPAVPSASAQARQEAAMPPIPAAPAGAQPRPVPAQSFTPMAPQVSSAPPTPAFSGSLASSPLSSPMQKEPAQQEPSGTHYLTPDQDDPYKDDSVQQFNSESSGGQS